MEQYPMEFNKVLSRYFYLGTDRPFYIHKSQPLDVEEGRRILTPIKELVQAILASDGSARKAAEKGLLAAEPVATIVKAMRSGTLVRNNECLFVLAYLARIFVDQEDKHKVYEQIPQIIETSQDLFMFVHFYRLLAPTATAGKGKGFGYGLRGALTKWYDKHSPEKLAILLASDSGWNNWNHKDILKMVHINLNEEAKRQVIDAAIGDNKKYERKPKNNQKVEKLSSNLENLAIEPNSANNDDGNAPQENQQGPPTQPPQAQNIREEAANNDGEPAGDNNAPQENRPNGEENVARAEESALEIYKRIKKFKASRTAAEACEGIRTYGYSLQLVPNQLHRAQAIWENLLPNMSYKEILESMLVFQDYKFIKEEDNPFSLTYSALLDNMTAVTQSKVSPMFVYRLMRLYEEKQRYLDTVKEAVHTTNNLILKCWNANVSVLRQTYGALNCSMMNLKPTRLNYFICLDLRSKTSKKRVFGNRLMSCQAASVLLALPILKCEKEVDIYTFTESSTRLERVNLTREMYFSTAYDELQKHGENRKTRVDINFPFIYVMEQGWEVDVFITIVDSLSRVNPHGRPPWCALDAYNRRMGKKACSVFVNLCRHQQDFIHLEKDPKKGILELTGCSEDTMKVIYAYVTRKFQ